MRLPQQHPRVALDNGQGFFYFRLRRLARETKTVPFKATSKNVVRVGRLSARSASRWGEAQGRDGRLHRSRDGIGGNAMRSSSPCQWLHVSRQLTAALLLAV